MHVFPRTLALISFAFCGACTPPAPVVSTTLPSATVVPSASTTSLAKGCPNASALRMVHIGTDVPRADKRSRMHERLFDTALKPEFSLDGEEEVISPNQARKLGSSMRDEPIWIFGDAGKPMCKMVPQDPVLVHINTGPRYSRLERLLDGECGFVTSRQPRVAVQQAAAPEGCEFFKVASTADPKTQALVPQKKCVAPECEARSKMRAATGKRQSALEITATFFYPTAENECNWKREDFYRLYLRDNGSDKLQSFEDNLDLYGLLEADAGPSIIVTYEPGLMRFFEASLENAPKLAVTIETDVSVEGTETHSLGPDCGP